MLMFEFEATSSNPFPLGLDRLVGDNYLAQR